MAILVVLGYFVHLDPFLNHNTPGTEGGPGGHDQTLAVSKGESLKDLDGTESKKVNTQREVDEMKYTQVKNVKYSKTDNFMNEEVLGNVSKFEDNTTSKDDRNSRLLKREIQRRKIEKEALSLPEEIVHEARNEEIVNIAMEFDENATNSIEPVPTVKQLVQEAELTPDLIGLYTLTLAVPPSSDLTQFSTLQEDIAWFDTPVSLLCMENPFGAPGAAMLEVKLRDKDMAMAVLQGLKHKYPGLEGDVAGLHSDILPDKKTGLFTLCFTDIMKKRYKATMDKFKIYSKQPPIISRGLVADQVLVAFQTKEEAVEALRANLDSGEFKELHVASASRS